MTIRYYLDDGSDNKAIDTKPLAKALHALYTHWVNNNGHRKDFIEAVRHCASVLYCELLVQFGKDLSNVAAPQIPVISLADPAKAKKRGDPHRFYDEDSALSNRIDSDFIMQGLAPYLLDWVSKGYMPREFHQVASELAAVVVYDHEISMALGGMGGCKSSDQFLTQEYQGLA